MGFTAKDLKDLSEGLALILSHSYEESEHPRGEHGRWASKGSASKNGKSKASLAKKIIKKSALMGTAYGAIGAGTGIYLKKKGVPLTKKHIAQIAAIGGATGTVAGATQATAQHYIDEHPKKAVGALAASVIIPTFAPHAYRLAQKYRGKTARIISKKMKEEIIKSAPEVKSKNIGTIRQYVRAGRAKAVYSGQKPPEHINKLLKQLHYYDKFNTGSHSYRRNIIKQMRKHYGIKTFGEHVKNIIFKAIRKFRGPKVVKAVRMLT